MRRSSSGRGLSGPVSPRGNAPPPALLRRRSSGSLRAKRRSYTEPRKVLSESQMNTMRKIFKWMDLDNDNSVSKIDLRGHVYRLGEGEITEEDIEDMVIDMPDDNVVEKSAVDLNKSRINTNMAERAMRKMNRASQVSVTGYIKFEIFLQAAAPLFGSNPDVFRNFQKVQHIPRDTRAEWGFTYSNRSGASLRRAFDFATAEDEANASQDDRDEDAKLFQRKYDAPERPDLAVAPEGNLPSISDVDLSDDFSAADDAAGESVGGDDSEGGSRRGSVIVDGGKWREIVTTLRGNADKVAAFESKTTEHLRQIEKVLNVSSRFAKADTDGKKVTEKKRMQEKAARMILVLTEMLGEFRSTSTSLAAVLAEELKRYEKKCNELEYQIEYSPRVTELRAKVTQLTTDLERFSASLEKKDAIIEELRAERVSDDVRELRTEIRSLREKEKRHTAEADRLRERNRELASRLLEAQQDLLAAQDELGEREDTESSVLEKDMALRRVSAQRDELARDKVEYQDENDRLRAKIAALDRKLSEQDARVRQLEHDISAERARAAKLEKLKHEEDSAADERVTRRRAIDVEECRVKQQHALIDVARFRRTVLEEELSRLKRIAYRADVAAHRTRRLMVRLAADEERARAMDPARDAALYDVVRMDVRRRREEIERRSREEEQARENLQRMEKKIRSELERLATFEKQYAEGKKADENDPNGAVGAEDANGFFDPESVRIEPVPETFFSDVHFDNTKARRVLYDSISSSATSQSARQAETRSAAAPERQSADAEPSAREDDASADEEEDEDERRLRELLDRRDEMDEQLRDIDDGSEGRASPDEQERGDSDDDREGGSDLDDREDEDGAEDRDAHAAALGRKTSETDDTYGEYDDPVAIDLNLDRGLSDGDDEGNDDGLGIGSDEDDEDAIDARRLEELRRQREELRRQLE